MADLFDALAARALGVAAVLAPQPVPRFAPADAVPDPPESVDAEVRPALDRPLRARSAPAAPAPVPRSRAWITEPALDDTGAPSTSSYPEEPAAAPTAPRPRGESRPVAAGPPPGPGNPFAAEPSTLPAPPAPVVPGNAAVPANVAAPPIDAAAWPSVADAPEPGHEPGRRPAPPPEAPPIALADRPVPAERAPAPSAVPLPLAPAARSEPAPRTESADQVTVWIGSIEVRIAPEPAPPAPPRAAYHPRPRLPLHDYLRGERR